MSVISIKVEGSPGCTIEAVCERMIRLSRRLEIDVECQFNDVLLIARPTDDFRALVDAYKIELVSKRPYKIAVSQREGRIPLNNGPEPIFLTDWPTQEQPK